MLKHKSSAQRRNQTAAHRRNFAGTLPLLALGLMIAAVATPALAGRDDQQARVDANAERDAARDAARAEEQAARAEIRAAEERTRTEIRAAEDAARAAADAAEDAARAAEDAARAAADAAEEAAKDAADAAEEAAKEAADAAEDAAEAQAESSGSGSSGSGQNLLHDLAHEETPEFDADGYPVRRGEIIAIDLDQRGRAMVEAQGFRVIDVTRLPALDSGVTRLAVPEGVSAQDALDRLRQADSRASFDLAHYYGAQTGVASGADDSDAAPSEPIRFTRSNAPIAPRLLVGMIDTNVAQHPALLGVRVSRRDFGDGQPTTDHGTAVASVLAADGVGQIYAASVFRGPAARRFTSPDAIIRALAWMIEHNVPVINISLAGPRNAVLDRLIARARSNGFLIVAAAGNGGPTAPPAYPAALPDVVAVTAIDRRGHVYRQANQGSYIDFAALGVSVEVASASGQFGPASGTSFAAPHVAALLGRCAARPTQRNDACVTALERQAVDLGAPGRDTVYGAGAIQ